MRRWLLLWRIWLYGAVAEWAALLEELCLPQFELSEWLLL
jgi:hypothetical protein